MHNSVHDTLDVLAQCFHYTVLCPESKLCKKAFSIFNINLDKERVYVELTQYICIMNVDFQFIVYSVKSTRLYQSHRGAQI